MKYFISEMKYKMNDILSSNIKIEVDSLKNVRENGFTAIENFITVEECEKLRNEIDLMCEKDYVWRDKFNSDIRIHGVENVNKNFKNLFSAKILVNVFKKYINKNKIHQFIMTNRVTFTQDNLGSGGGWHRDTMNRRQLKFILYLCDVDDKNGCFQYISKSHTVFNKLKYNRVLQKKFSEYRYSEKEIEDLKEKLNVEVFDFKGKAGMLIIADTSGLHRGKPILSGSRYAATNYMSEVPFAPQLLKLIINEQNT